MPCASSILCFDLDFKVFCRVSGCWKRTNVFVAMATEATTATFSVTAFFCLFCLRTLGDLLVLTDIEERAEETAL